MKKLIHQTTVLCYENKEELVPLDLELLKKAKEALSSSFSPYSGFKVGAAVRLKSGEIIIGSNQENAAYPLCTCAERVAMTTAVVQYPKAEIEMVAITIKNIDKEINEPASPCGACRQIMLEIEQRQKKNIKVLLQGEIGPVYVFEAVQDLLPFSFGGDFL